MEMVDTKVIQDIHTAPERRCMVLEIDLDLFVKVFIPGPENLWFRCYAGLPEGVRVVGVDHNNINRRIRLALEHESFDVVEEGREIPLIGASFMSWSTAEEP